MANLTITLTEALALGDGSTERGTTNIQTVTVDEVDSRIMDIGATYVNILNFGAANAAGTFANATTKYLRITNLHASAFITLRVVQADAEYFVKIEPEDHFLLGNSLMDAHEDGDTNIGTGETLANISSIWAKSSTGTVQLEYFIASASA